MSFVDGGFQNGNTAQYCGPYASAPVVQLGELEFRWLPGVVNAIMTPQVRMIAGTKQWEFYSTEVWGAGGQTNKNANALALAQTWENIDVDGWTINDGSDVLSVILTPTSDADAVVIKAQFWCPTPTKVVTLVELFDPAKGLVLNDPTNQLVVHHHTQTFPDNVVTSTFNGQTYKWAEWVPQIAGQFMTVVSGTMAGTMGWNFRPNAAGNIELYGDGVGGSETLKASLIFTKTPTASLTRFGTFS
jgi:hypothetical protein